MNPTRLGYFESVPIARNVSLKITERNAVIPPRIHLPLLFLGQTSSISVSIFREQKRSVAL